MDDPAFIDDLEIDWTTPRVGLNTDLSLYLEVQLCISPDPIWQTSFNRTASEHRARWKAEARKWKHVRVSGKTVLADPIDDTESGTRALRAELDDLVKHVNRVAAEHREKVARLTQEFHADA
jgi:hypothetical protein